MKIKFFVYKTSVFEKNIITTSYEEIKEYAKKEKGFFKSFSTYDEALNFSKSEPRIFFYETKNYPTDTFECYVDGSWNLEEEIYGYGVLYKKDGKIIDLEYGFGNNSEIISMRQIGGELLGAMKALSYAKKKGYKDVLIFFDYMGVAMLALNYWEGKDGLKGYHDWMNSFFENNKDINVNFCKIKSHTLVEENEIADTLAKKGCNVIIPKKLIKICEKNNIFIEKI